MSARVTGRFVRVAGGLLLIALALAGFLGVVLTARDASATTRAVQDGSRADVVRAIAGGPGEPATSQLVALAANPPEGMRFSLVTDADIYLGQRDFLAQVLRFALFPAILEANPARADYIVEVRTNGDSLTVGARERPGAGAAP